MSAAQSTLAGPNAAEAKPVYPVIENGDLKIVRSFGRVQFFPEGDV